MSLKERGSFWVRNCWVTRFCSSKLAKVGGALFEINAFYVPRGRQLTKVPLKDMRTVSSYVTLYKMCISDKPSYIGMKLPFLKGHCVYFHMSYGKEVKRTFNETYSICLKNKYTRVFLLIKVFLNKYTFLYNVMRWPLETRLGTIAAFSSWPISTPVKLKLV